MNNCTRTSLPLRAGAGRTWAARSGLLSWRCLCLMLGILSSSTGSRAADTAGAEPIPSALRDDVYAIYALAVNDLQQNDFPGSEGETIAIYEKTGDRQSALSLLKCHTPVPAQRDLYAKLFKSFRRALTHRWVIEHQFQLMTPYVLTKPGESPRRSESSARSSQRESSKNLPENQLSIKTRYTLSAVGFNEDRSRALVYAGCECGELCGYGYLHFLIKVNGRWKFDDTFDGEACNIIS